MPEYLSPGVYVEEVPSGANAIEGVSTSTAAFIGRSVEGPINEAVGPILSIAEYTKQFGDGSDIQGEAPYPNYLWHAVRAFFTEGGKRLYVARVGSADSAPRIEDYQRGLDALGEIEEVALVAAPGATEDANGFGVAVATSKLLIDHAERTRRCIALLDSPKGRDVDQVLEWRSQFASSRAALYYPWVRTHGLAAGRDMLLPPSGAIAGIIARTDIECGVYRAPANRVVLSAIGLERALGDAHQNLLNSNGVNCLRLLEGQGIRVWGARTLAADTEWKYVNVRRLFIYLEQSIQKGLGWTVFEPNREPLWAKVRATVMYFLFPLWRQGALAGAKPEEAFFVRCDRTTMTQVDIDSGRLICVIGAAPLRPAEFVVFRVTKLAGHP